MDVQKAQARYVALKALSHTIKKEMDQLRGLIRSHGIDPDPRPDRSHIIARNKEIYIAWKDGQKLNALAKKYKLSATTVRNICHSIDLALESKMRNYKDYKDLLPYK